MMTSEQKEKNAVSSSNNSDESKKKKKRAFFRRKNTKDKPKKPIWRKKTLFYFVTGALILSAFFFYPLLNTGGKNSWIPQLKWFPIQNEKSITFEPFIIPYKSHGKFTYISLSISFELPNNKLKEEMIEKNTWIRGIIYNILNENINVLENISSLMKLKRFIINGVNSVLTAGKVDRAIITDFSTV